MQYSRYSLHARFADPAASLGNPMRQVAPGQPGSKQQQSSNAYNRDQPAMSPQALAVHLQGPHPPRSAPPPGCRNLREED